MKRFFSIIIILSVALSAGCGDSGVRAPAAGDAESPVSSGAEQPGGSQNAQGAQNTQNAQGVQGTQNAQNAQGAQGTQSAQSNTEIAYRAADVPARETETAAPEQKPPGGEDKMPAPNPELQADEEDTEENMDMEEDDAMQEEEAVEVAAPPEFGFIDGHADTITVAMRNGQGLFRNTLHVDLERLLDYGAPVQVFAIFTGDAFVSTAFEYANSAIDFFEQELAAYSDIIELALSVEDLERNARNNKISAILALEGAEPLMGNIDNLDHFYNRGVRLITLTWSRENALGYGVASGSSAGLKPFGVQCVQRMNELGIIIDVSHLNDAGFWDVDALSTRPYIASHSNAYSVTSASRNLKDDQIMAIVAKGGLIGLNMYPGFLSQGGVAGMDDILAHVSHFIALGAGGHVGLGCDFDGFDPMPAGFKDVSSLKLLAESIAGTFDDETAHLIMSGNYYAFFKRFFENTY